MSHTTIDKNSIVLPFTILIDNREKAPYGFDNVPPARQPKLAHGDQIKRLIVPTRTMFLPAGDYGIEGMIQDVAVERKSLEDLYSTLGQNRERFEREIKKLNRYFVAAVIVEADLRQILRPAEFRPGWRSRLSPKSVYGTLLSWEQKYRNVHWHLVGSRRAGEMRTLHTLEKFWLNQQKEKQEEDAT